MLPQLRWGCGHTGEAGLFHPKCLTPPRSWTPWGRGTAFSCRSPLSVASGPQTGSPGHLHLELPTKIQARAESVHALLPGLSELPELNVGTGCGDGAKASRVAVGHPGARTGRAASPKPGSWAGAAEAQEPGDPPPSQLECMCGLSEDCASAERQLRPGEWGSRGPGQGIPYGAYGVRR